MALWVKLLFTAVVSQTAGWSPNCSISKPVPSDAPGEAMENGPSTWASTTHMRNLDEAPGYYLWFGFILAVTDIWGNEVAVEGALFLFPSLSDFQIKIYLF